MDASVGEMWVMELNDVLVCNGGLERRWAL